MFLHPQIVIASADVEGRRALTNILVEERIEPIITPTVRGCIEILAKENVQLIFCDSNLADGTFRDLLEAARTEHLRTRIVVTSRSANWDEFLEAARLGAFDVITSPCRSTDVDWMIIQAQRDEVFGPDGGRKFTARGVIGFRQANTGRTA
jgi:DNA-binding NtrC family response regulator